MGTHKHFSQQEFKQVKLLQEAGLSQSRICKVLNRSDTPIHSSMQAKTWDEYKALTAARYLKHRARLVEKAEQEPQQAIKFTPPERPKDEVIVLLRSIDNKLSVLVENIPVRKGIFR